jgi:spore coat polysaccharide biosynthesis protein SpsF
MPPLKTLAIIQARMASSRLPNKVLLDIAGKPMLAHVLERTRLAQTVDTVVVATTTDPGDDAIDAFCRSQGYACHRGSAFDVLDRYYQAALSYLSPEESETALIVRITADCPLIDPQLIDRTVCLFLGLPEACSTDAAPASLPYDFAANRLPPPWGRTYPIGLDTEVTTFTNLRTAWKEAQLPHQREHVMPYFYEQPERFRILLVNHEVDYGKLRWTVDTPEDLQLLRQIFVHLAPDMRSHFSWLDVLDVVQRHPELSSINSRVQHKHYRDVDARSKEAERSEHKPCVDAASAHSK